MDNQKYYVFRYSILPIGCNQNENQIAMALNAQGEDELDTKKVLIVDKEIAFKRVIDSLKEDFKKTITLNKETFKLYFIKEFAVDIVLLQLGRVKPITLNEEKDFSIESKEVPDIPNSYIIINLKEQICLIQKNTKLSSNITTIGNKFGSCINSIFDEWALSFLIKVKPITYSNDFWKVLTKNQGDIKFVEFKFISPNFLGASYNATNVLKFLKEETCTEETTIAFQNENGLLNLMNETGKDSIDYISNGGGSWKIKTKKNLETIKSDKSQVMIEAPQNIEDESNHSVNRIFEQVKEVEIENKNRRKSEDLP